MVLPISRYENRRCFYQEGDREIAVAGGGGQGRRCHRPHGGARHHQDQELHHQGGSQVQDQDQLRRPEGDCPWAQICPEDLQV